MVAGSIPARLTIRWMSFDSTMLRTLRRPFEYAGARLALAVLPRLQRASILRIARCLGHLAYWMSAHQRRIALANLQLAFPEQTKAQHKATLVKSLQSFSLVMLDIFWLARDTNARIKAMVRFDPEFERTILKPGAQICITAHMGNWEVLGLSVSQRGYPLASVAAPIKNPWVDELFNELRAITGQRPIPKPGALRALIKTLRQGDKIALVLDQNVKPVHGGVFVDFFGRKAPFSAAAAQLSRRTGAPLLVGTCLADDQGIYHTPPVQLIGQDGLPAREEEAVLELTQRIAHALETLIRQHPSYWLWTYKRWKIRPEGEDPSRYPFYTRALRPGDFPAGREEEATSPAPRG